MRRINVNLDEDLVAQIDSYAERYHINRTSAIALLTSQALDAQRATRDLSKLITLAERENVPKELKIDVEGI